MSLWLQGAALYLWSIPDGNGDEKADEEMEAEDDEVQHGLPSGLSPLPCLVPMCHKVLLSPSLSAGWRQRGQALPVTGLWRLSASEAGSARADKSQGHAGAGLIREEQNFQFPLLLSSP